MKPMRTGLNPLQSFTHRLVKPQVVIVYLWTFHVMAHDIWSEFKHSLELHGIEFNAWLAMDWSKNFHGGLNTNGTGFNHILDVSVLVHLEALAGLKDTDVFIDFQNINGASVSEDDVGDFQFVSNIDVDGRTQIAELWLEKRLFDDQLRIKVGKVEANYEFAYVENGLEFAHSSPGFSPTILNFPSNPDPATSVNIFVYPNNFYLGAGIYDGSLQEGIPTGSRGPKTLLDDPSDLFVVGETGVQWQNSETDRLPGRLALGVWHHTGDFQQFDNSQESGTEGFYLLLDQSILERNISENDAHEIKLFLQFGYADGDVSEADLHTGGGIALSGFIPQRNDDELGVMASYVHFSSEAEFVDSYELALEAFYKLHINHYLVVKPDLQFIVNPGGEGLKDALVGLLRIEVAF